MSYTALLAKVEKSFLAVSLLLSSGYKIKLKEGYFGPTKRKWTWFTLTLGFDNVKNSLVRIFAAVEKFFNCPFRESMFDVLGTTVSNVALGPFAVAGSNLFPASDWIILIITWLSLCMCSACDRDAFTCQPITWSYSAQNHYSRGCLKIGTRCEFPQFIPSNNEYSVISYLKKTCHFRPLETWSNYTKFVMHAILNRPKKITIFEGALPAISSVSRVKCVFSRSRHDRKRAIFLNLTLIDYATEKSSGGR